MDASTRVVRVATGLLPAGLQERYREQWLADLRDAEEVGIGRGQIAWGALRHGMRRYRLGARAVAIVEGGEVMAGRQRWMFVGVASAALLALTVWQLWTGFSAVPKTSFRSPEDVVGSFFAFPFPLLFPVAVALLSGSSLASQLSQRFIASTRTRTGIRGYLVRRILTVMGLAFGVFFLLGVVIVVCGYWVAPALLHVRFDPAGYNLYSAQAIFADSVKSTPLTVLLAFGPVVYILGVAVWMGGNAAVLALVTVVSVLLIERRVLALLLPFALYMVESVVAQFAGFPGASFIISAVYPAGLQDYSFAQALLPSVLLAAATVAVAGWLVASARSNPRLA